jgi:threonine synthase
VLEAIDGEVPTMDEYDMVNILNERSKMPVPKSLAELKGKERRFNGSIEKENMETFVLETLGL